MKNETYEERKMRLTEATIRKDLKKRGLYCEIHERRVNALIPRAEEMAKRDGIRFFECMNTLTKAAGLRVEISE